MPYRRQPSHCEETTRAGGPEVGLYLPTKVFVYETADGAVHVSYDRFVPIMARFGIESLDTVARAIDEALQLLAMAAAD